jgi:hypothetical protein
MEGACFDELIEAQIIEVERDTSKLASELRPTEAVSWIVILVCTLGVVEYRKKLDDDHVCAGFGGQQNPVLMNAPPV